MSSGNRGETNQEERRSMSNRAERERKKDILGVGLEMVREKKRNDVELRGEVCVNRLFVSR